MGTRVLLLWDHGTPRQKPTGRPPKLSPAQQAALATLIDEGPLQAGLSGACGRSPMIQPLIDDRFGVFDNVFYMIQLLKNLGFSYQKAAFVLTSETYLAFLTRVLAQVTQPILLIQEGAKYHTSAAMQCFFALHTERLKGFQLPSDSPDNGYRQGFWSQTHGCTVQECAGPCNPSPAKAMRRARSTHRASCPQSCAEGCLADIEQVKNEKKSFTFR